MTRTLTADPRAGLRGRRFVIDLRPRRCAVVLMLLGLRQWAVILGVIAGDGGIVRDDVDRLADGHDASAVVDLVAAVGPVDRGSRGGR